MNDDYEKQADDFLKQHKLGINIAFRGDRCPSWCERARHVHGDRYQVNIYRPSSPELVDTGSVNFDFWNSKAAQEKGEPPTSYDVLACISSDAYSPTDPDEVVKEFGSMKPSQAIAIAEQAKMFQEFFSEKELEDLAEIQ